MSYRVIAALLGVGLGLSCGDAVFYCSDDAQCMYSGAQGVCQANQYCTFPDDTCPSGQRYGENVGADVAGTCFESESSNTGTGSSGTSTTSAGTSSAGSMGMTSSSSSQVDGTSTGESTDAPKPDLPASDSSSSDGGTSVDPYGSCSNVEDCNVRTSECIDLGTEDVCAPGCNTDDDCPPLVDSSPVPLCVEGFLNGVCVLPCQGSDRCPPGMDCNAETIDNYGTPICVWD